MFDKLLDFLIMLGERILPFVIIKHYQQAVLLRFGKFKKVLYPGIFWKIPIFDESIEESVTITTISLSAQSLYTLDKQNIVVKAIIKYKVSDVKVFLLEVWDAKDALSDMTQSIIKNIIMSKTLEQCTHSEIDNELTKKVRVESKKWGIEVDKVTLTDLAPIRSYRILNDTVQNFLN